MKSSFCKKFLAKNPLTQTRETKPPNPDKMSESDASSIYGRGTREFIQWKLDRMGLSDSKDNNVTGGGGVYDKFSDEDFKPSKV